TAAASPSSPSGGIASAARPRVLGFLFARISKPSSPLEPGGDQLSVAIRSEPIAVFIKSLSANASSLVAVASTTAAIELGPYVRLYSAMIEAARLTPSPHGSITS